MTLQVYTNPVYCTSVHKSSLVYKCTQNQFAKLVTNKWNVQGQNITKLPFLPLLPLPANKWNLQGQNITNYLACLCLPLPFSTCLFLSLPASSFLYLPLPFSICPCLPFPLKFNITDRQSDNQTHRLNICTSRAASSQLKTGLCKSCYAIQTTDGVDLGLILIWCCVFNSRL